MAPPPRAETAAVAMVTRRVYRRREGSISLSRFLSLFISLSPSYFLSIKFSSRSLAARECFRRTRRPPSPSFFSYFFQITLYGYVIT